MATSERHEELVKQKVEQLETEGWHIVTIGRNHPDAIAVKDGVIMAVEVLRKIKRKDKQKRKGKGQSRGWRYQGGLTLAEKVRRYSRFDKTLFVTYYGSTGEVADEFAVSKGGRYRTGKVKQNMDPRKV